MRVAVSRRVVFGLALSLLCGPVLGPQAEADPGSADSVGNMGDVIFVRDGALLRQPILRKGKAVTLLALEPALAKAERLAVSPDGHRLVVSSGSAHAWIDLQAPEPRLRALVCTGNVTPSNRAFSCGTATGYTAILGALGRRVVNAMPQGARVVATHLVHANAGGLWKLDLATGGRTQLSDHRPDAHLLVAPDGKRAVGVYGEGRTAGLESFRLDGKAVRRKLLRRAQPIMWSDNSKWLLAQMGRRACVLRAVGGQYKCWKRYRAVGLAPDGSWALLSRPGKRGRFTLFRAELAGANTARPKAIAENVEAAAVWLSR